MKVLIFGATGMVGQGVLHECLAAPDVTLVMAVGRTQVTQSHPRLQQRIVADLRSLTPEMADLADFDACFYCLGVSSSGMREETYRQVTHTTTLHVAGVLADLNPEMTFVYVSGAGTDSSEQGRSMWARIKGQTENDLKKLPFQSVYLFRPSVIQPLHGIQSKTPFYRHFYRIANPVLSIVRSVFPRLIVTSDDIGQAMLQAARQRAGRVVLESKDIVALARS